MAAVSIRDLDDEVRERLKVRAAQHGRSMEAEIRAILTDAVSPPAAPPVWRRRSCPASVTLAELTSSCPPALRHPARRTCPIESDLAGGTTPCRSRHQRHL